MTRILETTHGVTSIRCTRLVAPMDRNEQCGAEIVLHGIHWCAEVCPKCLANYRHGSGDDYGLHTDLGFYPADMQASIRANIAKHGGRYIPHFDERNPAACGEICDRVLARA